MSQHDHHHRDQNHHQHGHHDDHHQHGHHDDHHREGEREPAKIPETAKLAKMVEHWIRHSDEHATSYRDWAGRARALGHEEVYRILEEVASATQEQNQNLGRALELLRRGEEVKR